MMPSWHVTFWSCQLQSYPCQQWCQHVCHVNSQVSHICHIRVTLLACHSLPCHLHINSTSTVFAASAIVTTSLVSIILSEPTLTWADLTQIQHLLNQTFDYNWPLTFLALITNFDFDQLSKVHFSFFNYAYPKSFFAYILILGLFFHMALTSLKFDHISFWVHLYTKFANSLTYSFHIGSDPRSIQCSHSWTLSCIIQGIFKGSSQVYIPNSRHRQTSTLGLRECWRY